MNPANPQHTQFGLVRDILATADIIARFNPHQAIDTAARIARTGKAPPHPRRLQPHLPGQERRHPAQGHVEDLSPAFSRTHRHAYRRTVSLLRSRHGHPECWSPPTVRQEE
jgi:hypothetical protein